MMVNDGSGSRTRDSIVQSILEYDGSFSGFLCAVDELVGNGSSQPFVKEYSGCTTMSLTSVVSCERPCELFEERRAVPRDDLRARQLWVSFRHLLGPRQRRIVMECFYSDREGADNALASLLVRSVRFGGHVFDDLGAMDASQVDGAAVRTRRELELILGLTRFSELANDGRGDGLLYACIRPSCNLLYLIRDHFDKRFPGLRWIIHDGTRHTALVHEPDSPSRMVTGFQIDPEYCYPTKRENMDKDHSVPDPGGYPPLSAHEREIRSAWCLYFHKVAIHERVNAKLQKSRIPAKYRTEMTEFGVVHIPDKKLGYERLESRFEV